MTELDFEQEQEMTNEEVMQLVCFKFADEEYAVDITHVREVVRVQRITPIPQMPEFTLGVINIRGFIIPVFDLRKKFGLQENSFDDKTKLLIADIDGDQISFIVDEILDNIKVGLSIIDPSPNVRMQIKRECIRGVAQLENRMIIILDLDKLNIDVNEDIKASYQKE